MLKWQLKTKVTTVAFTSIEIYRKTQLGLNSGLLLMHTVHHVNIPDIFMYIYNLFNYALFLLIYINFYWQQWEFSAFSITKIWEKILRQLCTILISYFIGTTMCMTVVLYRSSILASLKAGLWVFILQFSNVYFSFINLIKMNLSVSHWLTSNQSII